MHCRLLLVMLALIGLSPCAVSQEVQPPRSLAALALSLEAEAGKTSKADLSRVFKWLGDSKNRSQIGLSAIQIDFIQKIEALTRDIIKAWLFRDLVSKPSPTISALEARLSERGIRLRARLVAHAESITLEGILTPEQAKRVRKASGRKTEPLLIGHNGQRLLTFDIQEMTVAQLEEYLRSKAIEWQRSGNFMQILLGRGGLREAFPDGIERLSPARQQLAREYMPKIELPADQRELVERMDKLTLAIYEAWATRDLAKRPLPPRAILVERLVWADRLSDSLFTHSEAITLEGILSQSQADYCLSIIWDQLGPRALLDPALASRLRIARWQQSEVLRLLGERATVSKEMAKRTNRLVELSASNPELQAQAHQSNLDQYNVLKNVDEAIIAQALTPGQLRAFQRFMDSAAPTRRPSAKVIRPGRSD